MSTRAAHSRLKTNLRLAVSRLQLLGKKKAELAAKARKEVADFLSQGKLEKARVRVEHIITEDYLVEALELLEMHADRLLSRLPMVLQLKEVEPSIAESLSSVLWAAPKLSGEVPELKVVSELLSAKFGRRYTEACRRAEKETISTELKQKLSLDPPPKVLVEKYLIEISRIYKVPYTPDREVMLEDKMPSVTDLLIDINEPNDSSRPSRPIGFVTTPSSSTNIGFKPFNYPKTLTPRNHLDHGQQSTMVSHKSTTTNDLNSQTNSQLTPRKPVDLSFLNLPTVPSDIPDRSSTEDDEDFEDIARRFQDLKRK